MNANQRSINDLRYFTRNRLIIPNNLDIRRNRTVSKSPLGFAACLSKNPRISQSSASPLYKEKPRILLKLRKNNCNRKQFGKFFANLTCICGKKSNFAAGKQKTISNV